MTGSVFYCEVELGPECQHWEFPSGIYTIPDRMEYTTKILRCMSYSTRVWLQGPRGKVRLRKGQSTVFYYVTNNQDLMKEFMWVKLKAQPLKNYP